MSGGVPTLPNGEVRVGGPSKTQEKGPGNSTRALVPPQATT